jgi:hypothetical protein
VKGVAAVLLAAAVLVPGAASAAEEEKEDIVATITDRRVPESSGLVQSTTDPALAYTVNDSGNLSVVYVIELATGELVGSAALRDVELVDAEALAVGADDRLYVADIGDNNDSRPTVSLYAVAQPGRGDRTVDAVRHRVRYTDKPHNAEALVSDVLDGSFYILGKSLLGADVYRLGPLRASGVTPASPLDDVRVPPLVTDADVAPLRGGVVARTYTDAYVLALPGWEVLDTLELPQQRQGETLAIIDGGPVVYVGTEGLPSPLSRVRVPDGAWQDLSARQGEPDSEPTPDAETEAPEAGDAASGGARTPGGDLGLIAVGGVAVLLLAGALLLARLRARR